MNITPVKVVLGFAVLTLIFFSGCTAPLVSVERSGPLFQSEIRVEGSGNGNTAEGLPGF